MKKILAIFLSVAMLFSLTACNSTDSSSATATAAPTEIPLTTTVNINEDGNIECRVVETYGYNDLLFTFDGDKLTKVEGVFKITGDYKLYQKVQSEMEQIEKYFNTLEFDETNQSVNCVYSKDGMKACSFTDKTPDELKVFLEGYSADNTIGLSPAQAGDIFENATPAP